MAYTWANYQTTETETETEAETETETEVWDRKGEQGAAQPDDFVDELRSGALAEAGTTAHIPILRLRHRRDAVAPPRAERAAQQQGGSWTLFHGSLCSLAPTAGPEIVRQMYFFFFLLTIGRLGS